jgi:Protein of unknown function (DUF1553)
LLRGLTPTSLEVFDYAEQGMVTGRRDSTTVAPQALYLLNDPFVRRQSLNLAERLLDRAELDDQARINLAYQLTLGRSATPSEAGQVSRYLADYSSAFHDVVVSAPKAVPAAEKPKVVVVNSDTTTRLKTPAPPVNPDEVIQVEEPVVEEVIVPRDDRTAAWASFCQALIGSAEFRYLR